MARDSQNNSTLFPIIIEKKNFTDSNGEEVFEYNSPNSVQRLSIVKSKFPYVQDATKPPLPKEKTLKKKGNDGEVFTQAQF
jgi:hypothetical protein